MCSHGFWPPSNHPIRTSTHADTIALQWWWWWWVVGCRPRHPPPLQSDRVRVCVSDRVCVCVCIYCPYSLGCIHWNQPYGSLYILTLLRYFIFIYNMRLLWGFGCTCKRCTNRCSLLDWHSSIEWVSEWNVCAFVWHKVAQKVWALLLLCVCVCVSTQASEGNAAEQIPLPSTLGDHGADSHQTDIAAHQWQQQGTWMKNGIHPYCNDAEKYFKHWVYIQWLDSGQIAFMK